MIAVLYIKEEALTDDTVPMLPSLAWFQNNCYMNAALHAVGHFESGRSGNSDLSFRVTCFAAPLHVCRSLRRVAYFSIPLFCFYV